MYKDFEEFLTYKCSEDGIDKDDAQDWLWNQEPTDLFKWANEYTEARVKAVHAEYLGILRKVEENLKGAL